MLRLSTVMIDLEQLVAEVQLWDLLSGISPNLGPLRWKKSCSPRVSSTWSGIIDYVT